MSIPIGPSIQVMFVLAEALVNVPAEGLKLAWERWIGPQRFARKLGLLEAHGWLHASPGPEALARVVCITEAGRLTALGGRDPLACWSRQWDGRWRLVLFDIPERQRALRVKLRRKLHDLRFGYLQGSVWVSPDPAAVLCEIMRGAGIHTETFSLIEGRPCGGETDLDVVRGAWDFEQIGHGYEVHMDVLRSAPGRMSSRMLREKWFAAEWRAWILAVRDDPLLPEVLLPESYRGREAWERRMTVLCRLVAGT